MRILRALPVTGAEIRVLRHMDPVVSAAYSPDGRFIVTASADDSARVWDADYRDFTPEERALYGIDNTPTCPQFGGE